MTAATEQNRKQNMSMHCNGKNRTPGEELYLVHLQRFRDDEDDHDILPCKRRCSSVGEELWEIHKRRSQGMDDEMDRDIEDIHLVDEKRKYPKNAVVTLTSTSEKKSEAPKCRYNLRSRDSSIIKKAWKLSYKNDKFHQATNKQMHQHNI